MTTSLDASGRPRQTFFDSWSWVQGYACAFLLWHLQSGLVDPGCLGNHDRCCDFDCRVFGELDGSAFAVVGEHDVPENGENSVWHRHLHDEVGTCDEVWP
jgi:hypothetical protein